MIIDDKYRDIIDEALHLLRSSNYVWQEGRIEHIDACLAAISQPAPFAVEVQPPAHVIEMIMLEMEGDYGLDTLRYVVYNDTHKGEWLDATPASAEMPEDAPGIEGLSITLPPGTTRDQRRQIMGAIFRVLAPTEAQGKYVVPVRRKRPLAPARGE